MWGWRTQLKPYQRLQRHGAATGANVRTTTLSEEAITALEQKYAVRLPKDFRAYLLQSCPMDEDNWDEALTSWWPLERIKKIPEEYEHKIENDLVARDASKYLFFADYMIWCWAWAIACGDDENRGRIVVINGVSDNFVANSFRQFVDLYVEDELNVA